MLEIKCTPEGTIMYSYDQDLNNKDMLKCLEMVQQHIQGTAKDVLEEDHLGKVDLMYTQEMVEVIDQKIRSLYDDTVWPESHEYDVETGEHKYYFEDGSYLVARVDSLCSTLCSTQPDHVFLVLEEMRFDENTEQYEVGESWLYALTVQAEMINP